MAIRLGREVCGDRAIATQREWLITNGLGGYASGTVSGLLTRAYHGLLIAALHPPGERTLLLAKLDETATYDGRTFPLCVNRWNGDGSVSPNGDANVESFEVDGGVVTWNYAIADALLQKQVWMHPGANATYVRYTLRRALRPLDLEWMALVDHRDHHSRSYAGSVQFSVSALDGGAHVQSGDVSVSLLAPGATATLGGDWYRRFDLATERERGLSDSEDLFRAAAFRATLEAGATITFTSSVDPTPPTDSDASLAARRGHDQQVLTTWRATRPSSATAPDWIEQLVLAADQFLVARPLPDHPDGTSVIAGYHWFDDWGRDTMISLPGLTLATGRSDVAEQTLHTFAHFVSQGMLPNNFPDDGSAPGESQYNTADATLWFFEAIRQLVDTTGKTDTLGDLFPVLEEIVDWHRRGTRYGIGLDPSDGLLRAGVPGVQVTWMDAKVGDWVVTPRIGKPVEINALWFNALRSMSAFAQKLGKPSAAYDAMADAAAAGFARFWDAQRGYCFDVIDGPSGNDPKLRPNQIFAVSLPQSPLTPNQQRSVIDTCARYLLTSYGLRSLAPGNAEYRGTYIGDQTARDGAYHQGTVWAWLLGPFALAHFRVYQDAAAALSLLSPVADHLHAAGLGTVSEIFDGDAPFQPRGCIAQAWSVAEVLRAWCTIEKEAR